MITTDTYNTIGLDILDITFVIDYDIPKSMDDNRKRI